MEKIKEAVDIQQALAVTELRNGNGRGLEDDEGERKKKAMKKTSSVAKIDELQFPSFVDEVRVVVEAVHTQL